MVFVMVAEQRRTSGYGSCGGVLADALSRGAKASPHLRSSGDEGAGQEGAPPPHPAHACPARHAFHISLGQRQVPCRHPSSSRASALLARGPAEAACIGALPQAQRWPGNCAPAARLSLDGQNRAPRAPLEQLHVSAACAHRPLSLLLWCFAALTLWTM